MWFMEKTDAEGLRNKPMDKKIKEQILYIRSTGLTNMFDVPMVQRLANEYGFYELLWYFWKIIVRIMSILSFTVMTKIHRFFLK